MNTTNLFLKKRLLTLCAAVTFATTVCAGNTVDEMPIVLGGELSNSAVSPLRGRFSGVGGGAFQPSKILKGKVLTAFI